MIDRGLLGAAARRQVLADGAHIECTAGYHTWMTRLFADCLKLQREFAEFGAAGAPVSERGTGVSPVAGYGQDARATREAVPMALTVRRCWCHSASKMAGTLTVVSMR